MIKIFKNNKTLIILLAIIVLTSFFRIWQLSSIPPGIYPDEAINGNEALSFPGKIFYPENNGREGLFINLIMESFLLFGISVWSLRIVPAIIGILTILGMYLLVKELFKKQEYANFIALSSSFLMAVSFWHVNFSRIGFRAILVPLILVFSFYFLLKGFNNLCERKKEFLISGAIFGIGFYTYIAFRMSVILIALVFFLFWIIFKNKGLQKKFLHSIKWWILACVIIALPIGIYFLGNPEYFVSRAGGVSIFAQDSNTPISQIAALGKSLIVHLGMFNVFGDYNWRHNISGSPILFWPVGIMFLIGFIYSIFALVKGIRKKDHWSSAIFGTLIGWWIVLLLPGILTYEGIPHSLRIIGAIPPVFIFSALGLYLIYQAIKDKIKIKRKSFSFGMIIIVLIFLLSSFIYAQYSRYFVVWGENSEVKGAFSNDYVKIGKYLNNVDSRIQKYVIVNSPGTPVSYMGNIPMPAQTVRFIEMTEFYNPWAIYVLPEKLEEIRIAKSLRGVVVFMQYDEKIMLELWGLFPKGRFIEKDGFWIYEIDPQIENDTKSE